MPPLKTCCFGAGRRRRASRGSGCLLASGCGRPGSCAGTHMACAWLLIGGHLATPAAPPARTPRTAACSTLATPAAAGASQARRSHAPARPGRRGRVRMPAAASVRTGAALAGSARARLHSQQGLACCSRCSGPPRPSPPRPAGPAPRCPGPTAAGPPGRRPPPGRAAAGRTTASAAAGASRWRRATCPPPPSQTLPPTLLDPSSGPASRCSDSSRARLRLDTRLGFLLLSPCQLWPSFAKVTCTLLDGGPLQASREPVPGRPAMAGDLRAAMEELFAATEARVITAQTARARGPETAPGRDLPERAPRPQPAAPDARAGRRSTSARPARPARGPSASRPRRARAHPAPGRGRVRAAPALPARKKTRAPARRRPPARSAWCA